MADERIPREQDFEAIAKMMDPSACRLDSWDDVWHVMAATLSGFTWQGVPCRKNLFDLRRYWEILTTGSGVDVVVETGVQEGGSAFFFMDALSAIRASAPYIGVDLDFKYLRPEVYKHEHSHLWIKRDCLASETVKEVARHVDGKRALVILDSVHTEIHVREELRLYAPLLSVGSWLVVEDTDHNGHPVLGNYGPSAWEAVEHFLTTELGKCYTRVPRVERLLGAFTNCPGGWLRRVG